MKPIKLFYSYSYKDEESHALLEKYLVILKRFSIVSDWHHRKIGLGEEWVGALDNNLEVADIILLLVSTHFINSDYCYNKEITYAIRKHEAGLSVVIPIILDDCASELYDINDVPLMTLRGVLKDMKPVRAWDNPDDAFSYIAKKIWGVAEGFHKNRIILELIRDVHRQAEWGGNDYANEKSVEALTQAEQHLARKRENHCFLNLVQALKVRNPQKTRELLLQALEQAATDIEKALVHYSLFKLELSEEHPDLKQAFKHLKHAIQLDELRYAPCDLSIFNLSELLGVSAIGYSLLATVETFELPYVVKCFWQNTQENLFPNMGELVMPWYGRYLPSLFYNTRIHRYRGCLYAVSSYLLPAVSGERWLTQQG